MGKKVFITGISNGLGHGFARSYLEDGDTVYGISRSRPQALPQSERLHFRSVDLAKLDGIGGEIRALLDGVERIDLAILNAGELGEIQDLRDRSLAKLMHTTDVNLWANKPIIDVLCENGRSVKQIVGISSGAAINGNRGWNAYSISKAALNMMIKLYARELPETHFTALAPGLIDTAMQEYAYTVPDAEKFPDIQRLRDARYTDAMPEPYEAAQRIRATFPKLLGLESGSFADVRKL